MEDDEVHNSEILEDIASESSSEDERGYDNLFPSLIPGDMDEYEWRYPFCFTSK